MTKPAGWKVLAALAVLVIVAGIVMHFPDRRAEQNTQPPATISRNSQSTPLGTRVSRSQPASPTAEAVEQPDDQLARLLALKLPRETVEEYLRLHNRSAQSLLAAFHASGDANKPIGDLSYLKEPGSLAIGRLGDQGIQPPGDLSTECLKPTSQRVPRRTANEPGVRLKSHQRFRLRADNTIRGLVRRTIIACFTLGIALEIMPA